MKIRSKKTISPDSNFFDIKMGSNHNFVLKNGMIAHNCGTGVGFSVERQYVEKLPTIAEQFTQSDTVIVVKDSKEGWAKAYRELVSLLIGGQIPKWDLSKIRPAGARLKTFGGRASGPRPLEDLFRFTTDTFKRAAGRKLTSIECHDIVCKIAEIVVVGGVRRSALISLSNLTDERMREAKTGQWWLENPQRALANNSVAYKEKPDIGVFMEEWLSLYKSKSGERGIFNRQAAQKTVAKLGERRDSSYEFGTNPCCLDGDTLVLTDRGEFPLSTIAADPQGYRVLSLCHNSGALEYTDIISGSMTRPQAEIVTLTVNCEDGRTAVLRITPDHMVWTDRCGYAQTRDLVAGDTVRFLRGDKGDTDIAVVVSVEQVDERIDTYDIQTPHQNFFANGVLVHNSEIILRDKEFCVSGTTPIITDNGIHEISDLVGQEVQIWNGAAWSNVTPRVTGFNQSLVRVTFSDGSYLDCTPDHRFSVKNRFSSKYSVVQAKDLMTFSKYAIHVEPHNIQPILSGKKMENAYTNGFAFGDGCVEKKTKKVIVDLYGDKDFKCPVIGNRHKIQQKKGYGVRSQRVIAEGDGNLILSLKQDETTLKDLSTYDRESILNFFAGWIDADGCNAAPHSIRLYIGGEHRARTAQLLLTRCGIKSSVNLLHRKGTCTNYGERKHDLWYLQIQNCSDIPCHRVNTRNTGNARYKGKNQVVRSVMPLEGLHTTYCFDEPQRHMGLFANVLTYQCNLSEVVVRPHDTEESLARKVRLAAILGTWQASLTHFPYLSSEWTKNCEEEALLGVSLTGIMDNALMRTRGAALNGLLERLRGEAVGANKEWAKKIGINPAAAITCIKPSGTVSQLTDAASGIHARHSQYYIRTVRADRKDPICQLMIDKGFPHEPCVMRPDHTMVFSFPMRAPGSLTRNDMTAIQQLELWLDYQRHWSEHKPSITVTVREHEWMEVGAWVYAHFDEISGISFLPQDLGTYRQAPYQDCTESEYNKLFDVMPKEVDWSELKKYELTDSTTGTQTFACTAGSCEIVDISQQPSEFPST